MGPLTPSPPPLPCAPPWWARGPHAQTILGHFLPSRVEPFDDGRARDVRVELADGDVLVGRHIQRGDQVCVTLLHGLSGSSEADYMRRTAAVCLARGYSVTAFNHRGCGAGAGLAGGAYHSGRWDDVADMLEESRRLAPGARQVAIGFSLSGNALLLLLARRDPRVPDFAIAVNPPVDLAACSDAISSGRNRLYDLRFLAHCRRSLKTRARAGFLKRVPHVPALATLRQFDDIATAPLGGFADADDYYSTCSTYQRLDRIERPTVILTSADDPFVDPAAYAGQERSAWVHLHVEPVGGHVGYLAARKTPLGTRRWLDYALDHYLAQLLGDPGSA